MTPEKYTDLKDRMQQHTSVNDVAVVVLTVVELEELLDEYCECGCGSQKSEGCLI